MNIQRLYLKKPMAYLFALSVSGPVFAHGIERHQSEIWHPNPEQLESTVETGEIAYQLRR